MPSSFADSTTCRAASAPLRWPSVRLRFRAVAQRPLPSMIIAMCLGMLGAVFMRLNLLDFLLFMSKCLFDLFDPAIGHFLDFFFRLFQLVLGQFILLGSFHAFAAHIAHSDL